MSRQFHSYLTPCIDSPHHTFSFPLTHTLSHLHSLLSLRYHLSRSVWRNDVLIYYQSLENGSIKILSDDSLFRSLLWSASSTIRLVIQPTSYPTPSPHLFTLDEPIPPTNDLEDNGDFVHVAIPDTPNSCARSALSTPSTPGTPLPTSTLDTSLIIMEDYVTLSPIMGHTRLMKQVSV